MASDATKQTINQSLIDLKAEVADRTKSVITGVKIPELEDTRIISNTDQLIIETGDGTKRTTMRAFGDFVGTGLATPKEVQDARGNYPQLGDRLDAMDGKIGTNEQNIQNNSQEIAELKAKHEADMREVIDARTDNKNPITTHNSLKERLDSDFDHLNSEIEKTNTRLSSAEIHTYGYLNVKSYGAVGDGTTDDYQAFQNCINDAYTLKVYKIYIPAGTYYCSQTIRTKSVNNSNGNYGGETLTIIGSGNRTILTNFKGDLADISASDNIDEVVNQAFFAIHSNSNIIEKVKFKRCKVALYIGQDPLINTINTNCHYNRFSDFYIEECGTGILFLDGYGSYYNNFNNFRITVGTIGIDMRRNFTGGKQGQGAGVCNRNNFTNGEISKQYCGVINYNGDTNTFDKVHFEGIGIGYGTKPTWLPDNVSTAIISGYESNTFMRCVLEGNTRDLFEDGYGNNFINNVLSIAQGKVKFNKNIDSLGTWVDSYAGGSSNVVKIGNIFYQSANLSTNKGALIESYPAWSTSFLGNVQDGTYALKNYGFKQSTENPEVVYKTIIGNTTGDNCFYHKKVGGINYVWVRGCFIVNVGQESSTIKLNLPVIPKYAFDEWAHRRGQRVFVNTNRGTATAYLRSGQVWIEKPSNSWSSQDGAYNEIDLEFTYPS